MSITTVSYTHLDVYKRQLVECREEIKQTVTETNETVIQVREELTNKISNIEEEGKMRVTELYQITTEECQGNKQEVLKKLEERHQEIQMDVNDHVEKVYTAINKIDGQTKENKEKFQGISQRERQMQEELDLSLIHI